MTSISRFLFVSLFCTSLFSSTSFAQFPKMPSLCGSDERVPSQVKPIARMMQSAKGKSGCTGTLISNSCMISAGHCTDYLKIAQFNVPVSSSGTGAVAYPSAMNQYEVEQVIGSRYAASGQDWSVYRLKKNNFSGKTAGKVQGFYKMNAKLSNLFFNQTIRITGYGSDDENSRNYTQQTATGKISASSSGPVLNYDVDTMPGNSGSSIILESTQEIIGIHTNGGCEATGVNFGTSYGANADFQQAVVQCLQQDTDS